MGPAACLLLRLGTAASPSTEDGVPWVMQWSDEFDGPAGSPPNASYWSLAGSPGVDPTHGPVEQQLYVPEAVALDGDGHCVIETKRERIWYPGGSQPKRWYNFTSGWLQSKGKVNATFGKWAVRARLPNPSIRGIWPAHWMIPEPSSWNCWPMGGEIDIMEMNGGVYGNTVVGTYSWSKNCSAGEPDPQPAPANCTCGCGCNLFFGKGVRGDHGAVLLPAAVLLSFIMLVMTRQETTCPGTLRWSARRTDGRCHRLGVNGHFNCTETSPWTCKVALR